MMFSFGLFATHTPYLVLAALYLCYMGSWLISSLFPQLPAEISSPPQQKIVIEQVVRAYDEAGITSNDVHPFNAKAIGDQVAEISIPPITGAIYHVNLPPLSGFWSVYTWRLLNRPPPFLS